MTEEQRRYLALVLQTLDALVPGARDYLLGLVSDLSAQDLNWPALLALLERAAKAAPDWAKTARAWMLAQLLPMVRGFGKFLDDKQSLRDYDALIAHIALEYDNMWGSASELEEEIVEQLLRNRASRRHLSSIELLQVHASRNAWGPNCFSNPAQHRSMSYCYVVHAMRPLSSIPRGTPSVYNELVNSIGLQYLSPNAIATQVNLHTAALFFDRPAMLTGEILSCSVISQNHTCTYGSFNCGFVLHVPATNVLMAAPHDLMASAFQNTGRPTTLVGQSPINVAQASHSMLEGIVHAMGHRLDAPAKVLQASRAGGHNEVLVLGRNGSNRVRPTAIFIKVNLDGCLWQSFLRDDAEHGLRAHILACAQSLNIPIIPIVERAPASSVSFESWLRGMVAPRLALHAPRPLRLLPPVSSELALVPQRACSPFSLHAPRVMCTHALSAGSGLNQIRLVFQLPERPTVRDIVELVRPLYRQYWRSMQQRSTGRAALTGPSESTAASEQTGTDGVLQLARSTPDTPETQLMQSLFEFLGSLLRDAQHEDPSTDVAGGMLTWHHSK